METFEKTEEIVKAEELEASEKSENTAEPVQSLRKTDKASIIIPILVYVGRVLLTCVLLGIIAVPYVIRYLIFPYQQVLDYYEPVDISLTKEQKLEDLEALYEYAFLMNPTCEQRAELYGVDYEALYEEYQAKIVDTQNEFEYYSILYDFSAYIGSGHTRVMYPHYAEVVNSGFQLNMEALKGDDTAAYYYNWEQALKKQYRQYYAECGSIRYVDGAYILHGVMDESIWPKEYWGAMVISVNGEDTIDFVIKNPFYNPLEHDDIHDVTFRYAAYFNESIGTPITLELLLADGTVVTYDTFMDPYAEMAMMVEYYDEAYVNNSDTDIVTDNYELVENNEDDFVYLRIKSCMTGEDDEKMVAELEDAISRHDKIIIDLRGNGGGYISYFSNYVTPYIFDETVDFYMECQIEKNDISTMWVSDPATRLLELIAFGSSDGTYHFNENLYYYGASEKRNEIFILVDENTYSSCDMFTYAASTLDNVTIMGTHTGGEGIEGPIFMYSLPNSRLCYSFTPCMCVETQGYDMLIGITPDVVFAESFEDRREYMQLYYEGENPDSYEIMIQYDDVLLDAIEYVKNAQ